MCNWADTWPMPRTITTDATGSRETVPELATVDVAVTGEGETATAARERARDRAVTLRASLTEQTVDADRVRRVDLRVEATDDLFEPVTDAAYQATERLEADCVPETAEAVVVAATDAGGTVRHVEFHLHESVRRRLQDEALEAATERAREKAERIAAAEGLTVAGVRELTTREASTGMNSIVDEALAQGDDANVHPEPVTVSAAVEAVYDLEG